MTDQEHNDTHSQTQDRAPPNAVPIQKKLSEIVEEYDTKFANIDNEVDAFEKAGERLKTAACIQGTWGDSRIDTGHVHDRVLKESLPKSAWKYVYAGLNIATLAPASDRKKFEQSMVDPAPFTLDNIRATFGDYLADPMGNILRGLAEVFSNLDPAFKSHDRMKVGVAGLPRRFIISYLNSAYGYRHSKHRH